jgi:hypothetical protein
VTQKAQIAKEKKIVRGLMTAILITWEVEIMIIKVGGQSGKKFERVVSTNGQYGDMHLSSQLFERAQIEGSWSKMTWA